MKKNLKRNWGILGFTAVFSAAAAMSAFAGQWQQDDSREVNAGGVSNWWYRNDDGSYPAGVWEWIDGNQDGTAECYYFDPSGFMYASAETPDGFEVNENGAWVVNGMIQTKQADHAGVGTGWIETSDGGWMYYTSKDRYATGWKKIGKDRYYFDDTGYMLTGYQELDDGNYYFGKDGRMAKATVHVDGTYYVIEDDGQIIDEVAEEDWTDYRRENEISSSADDIKSKTYDLENGINEEMALDFLDLVNAEREKKHADPLEINDALMEAAQIRAEELAVKYSHTRLDGTACYTVLDEVDLAEFSSAGENIAAGQRTPAVVVRDWMNSSGHKKNILNKDYTETGVACYIDSGTSYNVYWVQLFYTP